MALGSYRPLLADGQVRALLLGTSVAGVSTGLTFALVLAVQDHHSIAAAGLVAGAQTIGDGVLIPVRGRLIDQRGQHVLLPLAAVHAVFLIALAVGVGSLPLIALCVLSALAGMARAPLFASLRALWTDVARDQSELETAYSLHAVFNETLFVGGPLVVAAAATLVSPAGALVVVGALEVAGAAIFTATTTSRTWHGGSRTAGRLGALESAGMRTLALAGIGSGFLFGTLEVAAVAFARSHGAAALGGVAMAALAVGSAIGGLAYGAVTWTMPLERRLAILCGLVVLAVLPVGLAPSIGVLVLLMGITGLPVAPWVAVEMAMIDRVAPAGTATESTTWLIAAVGLGTAIGAALTGQVAEQAGAGWALELAGAGALGSLLVVLTRFRTLRP